MKMDSAAVDSAVLDASLCSGDAERSVSDRYAAAAHVREEALCCPVEYDRRYLRAIPDEVLERDYGCGDPSAWLRAGETVLDLGSGGGKICFIAAQVVGAQGRVIGVDMNQAMLALARRAAPVVAERIGYANVEFCEGRIQDLAFDAAAAAEYLAAHPVSTTQEALAFEAWSVRQRSERPLIADDSVDVVVSNCVLNLVRPQDKQRLFAEIYRVTGATGRVVISDIVSDEDVPQHLQEDPELWSGCVSGALREDRFVDAFARAGFHGARILRRDQQPWRTVEGIEFRSMTIEAFKGKQGPCLERRQAVIYRGPFSEVLDDDGHRIERGVRLAVCDKTFRLFQREPYREFFDFVEPRDTVPLEQAEAFDCSRSSRRDPRETKGNDYRRTTATADSCCGTDGDCC